MAIDCQVNSSLVWMEEKSRIRWTIWMTSFVSRNLKVGSCALVSVRKPTLCICCACQLLYPLGESKLNQQMKRMSIAKGGQALLLFFVVQ